MGMMDEGRWTVPLNGKGKGSKKPAPTKKAKNSIIDRIIRRPKK